MVLKFLSRRSGSRDPDVFFSTDHLNDDLRGRSVRSGAITIATQVAKFSLQMGGTLVLSRLLTPEDFGLIGMVAVILNFIELFKDLGLVDATVQKAKISHGQVSTLFWINMGLSSAITLTTIAAAPLIANFYGEPRLIPIMVVMACAFLLGGLASQHKALLQRQMNFAALAKIEVASIVTGTATAVILAYAGASYWALVFWRLVPALIDAVGVWLMCGWRPGLPKQNSGAGSMLAFGWNVTGFRTINYFARNADNILIGRFQGAQALGIYSIAYRLLLMPIQQINAPVTNVALPTLSRLQEEPQKFAAYYYKALMLITTVSMPMICFLFVDAAVLVELLLGSQWEAAAPLFQILAPAAFVGTVNVSLGWAFTSLGRVDKQLRQGICASIFTVIGFCIGVQYGITGVAVAYSITQPVMMVVSLMYCYQKTPLSLGGFFSWIRYPALPALGAALALSVVKSLAGLNLPIFWGVMIDGLAYCGFYVAFWSATPKSRAMMKEIFAIAKAMKGRSRES